MFQYIEEFLYYLEWEKDFRPNTLLNYKNCLKQLRVLPDFDLNGCREFLLKRKQEGVSNGYLQLFITVIRQYCSFLIGKGKLVENFGKNIPMPKRERNLPDILSVEELEKILNVRRTYKRGRGLWQEGQQAWNLFLGMLAKTGCRVGEIIALKVENLDLGDKVFKIVDSKTRKQRLVPIPVDMVASLKNWIKDKGADDLVFTSYRGKKMWGDQVGRELRLRAKIAGIKKRVYPHILRHSYITTLLTVGVPLPAVADLVGHEDWGSTKIYTHLTTETKKKAAWLHPLVRKNRDPKDILADLRETVARFKLDEDNRFSVSMTAKDKLFDITVFVK